MSDELQQDKFPIPAICISSPLLEGLFEEPEKAAIKLRKLGKRYDQLSRKGQEIWPHFRSALESSLQERVGAVRDALGYDPTALSPVEQQQWQDTHHQEVVSMLEDVCCELGWPTDYVTYIAPMFYDPSLETQQACFEQLFTGSRMGSPFISIAALTSDSETRKSFHLVGPHSFALQSHLSQVGDVVIKLNLKTISAKGLRQLECDLLLMKESLGAGEAYGSIPGRRSGYRKPIVANLTWDEIALIYGEDRKRFRELQQRFIDERLDQSLGVETEDLAEYFVKQAWRVHKRLYR